MSTLFITRPFRVESTEANLMPLRSTVARIVLFAGCLVTTTIAARADETALKLGFDNVVHPFLKNYCLGCHGAEKPKAKLNLSLYSSVEAVVKNQHVWDDVLDRLESEEMPPAKAPRQPTPHDRRAVIEWVRGVREDEARKTAGDPGPVWARRLNSAEYDNTIRDLTGVDLRPAREFPVDPANEAGFDNSGESLTMSPALVEKYLAAARRVADAILCSNRPVSRSQRFPVVTETDRDKYCVQRIVDYYRRHQVDYADYFLAAWRFRYRKELGKPDGSLRDIANEAKLSAEYLAKIWDVLNDPAAADSPLGKIQAMWQELPAGVSQPAGNAPTGRDPARLRADPRPGSRALRQDVPGAREQGVCEGHFRRQPAVGAVVEPSGRRPAHALGQ